MAATEAPDWSAAKWGINQNDMPGIEFRLSNIKTVFFQITNNTNLHFIVHSGHLIPRFSLALTAILLTNHNAFICLKHLYTAIINKFTYKFVGFTVMIRTNKET